MPAIIDDPTSSTIYRTSGATPFPNPQDINPSLPAEITPIQVTLRDRTTVATIVPFSSRHDLPPTLLRYLGDTFNKEIEGGDTYPMMEGMSTEAFSEYWFQNFGAIMLLGTYASSSEVIEGRDWATECLGSFYIKPNYTGRSSHVSNAGFLVTDSARNRGVGRLMGEAYIAWAPLLGYTYSVFNLVYETNVASCRIWDALGFKKIGRVPGAGNLKSYPDRLVDAIIYGRELGGEQDEQVCEERFDKIRYYLKYGTYPCGADRAEKSRLRSAATHYRLRTDDILMLKGREVVSEVERQMGIAREVHEKGHGGINKTTTTIAERFHWVRIKETVSDVIRNCKECKVKEMGKCVPAKRPKTGSPGGDNPTASAPDVPSLGFAPETQSAGVLDHFADPFRTPPSAPSTDKASTNKDSTPAHLSEEQPFYTHLQYPTQPPANFQLSQPHNSTPASHHDTDAIMPLDPQITHTARSDFSPSYSAQQGFVEDDFPVVYEEAGAIRGWEG